MMYEGTLYRGAIVRLPAIVVEREGRAIPYLPVDHRHYCLGCAQLVACPDPDPACLRLEQLLETDMRFGKGD